MENEIKSLSEVALAAKAIRAALKAAFPGTKFAVRSESFSMGNAVRIKWTDGPATDVVDAIASDFTSGDFDGMTDSYNYAKDRKGPTAKYVTCTREISPEILALTVKACAERGDTYPDEVAYRVLRASDLRGGFGALVAVEQFPYYVIASIAAVADEVAA